MPLSNAVLDFHPLGIVDTPPARASAWCWSRLSAT